MREFFGHAARAIVFTAGLLAILMVASRILVPKNNASDDGMLDSAANGILSEPNNTIDVLILGDSESYCALNPLRMWEQHGITAYCCGTPGQMLCYSQEFLKKAFSNQSPKIVILETNAVFQDFTFCDVFLQKANSLFPVFDYHNRWKSLKSHDLGYSINYTYIDNTKGYRFTTNASEASDSDYMKETDNCAAVSQLNRTYLENMKLYCEQRGAKLILLSTPSTVNWNSSRHNGIQKLSDDLGIEYIDMNSLQDDVRIDWKTDTRDRGDHLNYFGAQKATAYLGNYLAHCGLVENHSDDPNYSHWNDALEKFNKVISVSVPQ